VAPGLPALQTCYKCIWKASTRGNPVDFYTCFVDAVLTPLFELEELDLVFYGTSGGTYFYC
jgi:hypothetical protein